MAWEPQPGQQIPELFSGPIPELFSARFSSHFQEIAKIMSTPLTRRNFGHFQEIAKIMSTKTQTWHSWRSRNGAQKKVPESAGLVGGSGPLVGGAGPSLAQT